MSVDSSLTDIVDSDHVPHGWCGGSESSDMTTADSADQRSPVSGSCSLSSARSGQSTSDSDEAAVTTPWQSAGVLRRSLSITEEVESLWDLLQLTPDEISKRDEAVSDLRVAITRVWPAAVARVYGSFAYGLSLPGSPVDVACEHAQVPRVKKLLASLGAAGFVIERFTPAEDHAFASLSHTATRVVVNLSVVSSASPAQRSVRAIADLLRQFPAAAPVYACVRLIQEQSRGGGGEHGTTSYALLAMLLHVCHGVGSDAAAGDVLSSFCQWYGASASSSGSNVWVEDPATPGHNVLEGCTDLPRLRRNLLHCGAALRAWAEMGTGASGGRRAGRTPLSAIVAYGQLWARAELKSGAPCCPAWTVPSDSASDPTACAV